MLSKQEIAIFAPWQTTGNLSPTEAFWPSAGCLILHARLKETKKWGALDFLNSFTS